MIDTPESQPQDGPTDSLVADFQATAGSPRPAPAEPRAAHHGPPPGASGRFPGQPAAAGRGRPGHGQRPGLPEDRHRGQGRAGRPGFEHQSDPAEPPAAGRLREASEHPGSGTGGSAGRHHLGHRGSHPERDEPPGYPDGRLRRRHPGRSGLPGRGPAAERAPGGPPCRDFRVPRSGRGRREPERPRPGSARVPLRAPAGHSGQ